MKTRQVGLFLLIETFCLWSRGQFQPLEELAGCRLLELWPAPEKYILDLALPPHTEWVSLCRSKSGINSSDITGLCLLSDEASLLSSVHGGVLWSRKRPCRP